MCVYGCASLLCPSTVAALGLTPAPLPSQAELMSGLIEYCIELSQAAESTLPQESASGSQEAPSPSPPPTQRPKLRRQGSVVCSRLQHLSTIDYVEDGKWHV